MKVKHQPDIIQKITSRIVEKYQPEKIILFGSAAAGKMHEDSDLDLVIIKKTNKRFYDRIGEVLHLLWAQRPTPGIGVDILVYTPTEFSQMCKDSYFVKDEVATKGKVLYEQKSAQRC